MDLLFVLSFSTAILFLGMHSGHCAHIVGGKESVPHSRPYMAVLMRGKKRFKCGGTLIKPNWVLTAAHCSVNKGDLVVLGAHSRTEKEREKQYFQIDKIHYHPKYNRKTTDNDIKLLQLNTTAKLNLYVKTLPLPVTYEDVREGTQCLEAGWGSTVNGGKGSDKLREVIITVVDQNNCRNVYKNLKKRPVLLTKNMLCVGGVNNQRRSTCNGDSGGPLICGGVQRAVISFGVGNTCGNPKYPRVTALLTKDTLQWIKKVTF